MNLHQTTAAILVLSASICFTAAGIRTQESTGDSFGVMMFFSGLVLALTGCVGLVRACLLNVKSAQELVGYTAPEVLPLSRPSGQAKRLANGSLKGLTSPNGSFQLSPEVNAQLSLVSHMEGRERSAIAEEILRQNLPRYSGNAAG